MRSSRLLDAPSGPDRVDRLITALIECGTGEHTDTVVEDRLRSGSWLTSVAGGAIT